VNIRTKVVKIEWDSEKSCTLNQSLKYYIDNDPNRTLQLEYFNRHVLSAIRECDMLKYRTLGDTHMINSPQWFDKKCLRYKKITNHCLKIFRKASDDNIKEAKCKYLDARRSY
jgi:hypothetical protein